MSLACDERGLIRTEPEDGVMVVKSFRLSFRTVTAAVVFAVVLATGIQWRIRADAEAKENACIYSLRGIDSAKQQWALESRISESSNPTPTWADLSAYLVNDPSYWEALSPGTYPGFHAPSYPPNATYTIGPMSDSPTCSYSGHTFALYGLRVHVGNASVPAHDDDVLEFYVKHDGHEIGQRPLRTLLQITLERVGDKRSFR
jgi:hypothetical protein